jgi:dihydrodipicolinate synthase/N-acetylneuraminate lyase
MIKAQPLPGWASPRLTMTTLPFPSAAVLTKLRQGAVIPAQPLALNAQRKLDERRQRALTRYYIAAGAGGLAVGVHSTQFEIREPQHNLFEPVLKLAMDELTAHEKATGNTLIKVAGVCGRTEQAIKEGELAIRLGYDMGLLSLAALKTASDDELLAHCREVSKVIPIVGFYLQPSVGGRLLGAGFWRRFAEIPNVVAIKMAPFNRFQTIDVVRGVVEAGRALAPKQTEGDGIVLYTGNDDNIVSDLLGDWTFNHNGKAVTTRVMGGLLGHWAYWTRSAVELLKKCHAANDAGMYTPELMLLNRQVTDMNAAVFDPAHSFHGCIPGMHEVLRRQGLLEGTWCLNPNEVLSPGQAEEITRVSQAYPHLTDDDFIAANLDKWLR